MRQIDKAVLKFSAIFTLILMVLSVGYSVTVYTATDSEMSRERAPRVMVWQGNKVDVEVLFRERADIVRQNLLIELVILNGIVLLAGAFGSYFLARWALSPVEKSMEQQAQFVSDASHELKTPLAVIVTENEVTLRDLKAGKDDYKKQIESNLEEGEKLRALTERLLKLSQDERLELAEVDLGRLVEGVCERAAKSAGIKKIIIDNKVVKRKVKTNAEALSEIVYILLENAVKYSPAQSVVTMDYKKGKLLVSDQGPGILEKDLPRIFDRFYRAEKSRTSTGYGLGLSLAQKLAEQLNLKIEAKNHKPHGATFAIVLSS
jgi:signal transduction histidine kinase